MASILELIKHLQSTIEKHQNDEHKVLKCIDKLYSLGVTVQHLQDTGVGRTVNALRKEPGDVGTAAKALVNKWKLMVAAEENSEPEDYNHEASRYNGNENGKDSDDNLNQSRNGADGRGQSGSRHNNHKHMNGGSNNKRKYTSSEDEPETKKSRNHRSYANDTKVKVKAEPKTESESDSQSDSSESEVEVKKEKTSSPEYNSKSRHSYSHHEIKKEIKKEKETSHSTERHSSKHKDSKHDDRSTHKSSKHKSSKEKENSEEKHSKHKDKSSSSKHSSDKQKSSHKSSVEKHDKVEKSDKVDKRDRVDKSDKVDKREKSEKQERVDKRDKVDKRDREDKHAHASQSNADKHRHSNDKDKDRKERSKDKESDKSKKSSHSHKSEKKHSSSEKSKSKLDKSGSGSERDSSSHRSKKEEPKKKSHAENQDSDDGIGCESGASFAEALGMISPAKSSKKKTSLKDASSPSSSFLQELGASALLAPTAKLAPLPPLEISALPEISPNYRPRPPPKLLPHFSEEEALSAGISSKNQRTKVYSGNKIIGKIPTLYELCVNVIQENIDALEFTGGVPYDILKPVVDKTTPQQLFMLEHYNPYLMEDTDHLWKKFCEKHFRSMKRQEMETWREMYMRCQEEQEHRLKSLTANIRMTQEAKKAPVKQTKMAYVDSVVKPPRNIARKQAIHGTARTAAASPAARVASLASSRVVLAGSQRAPPAAPAAPFAALSRPKKAPLMQKALQFMRGRKR